MSYTSRAAITINEALLAHQPITFGYFDWAAGTEITLFSQLLDVTNFNALSIVMQATTQNRYVRVYFDTTKVAESANDHIYYCDKFDISAYSGVKRVEVRIYGTNAGEAYPATNAIPTLEVTFLTDWT